MPHSHPNLRVEMDTPPAIPRGASTPRYGKGGGWLGKIFLIFIDFRRGIRYLIYIGESLSMTATRIAPFRGCAVNGAVFPHI